MRPKGATSVGRFSVEIEVANYGDLALAERGLLPADQVRRETIHGLVDSGATRLVLPEAVVKRLGLPLSTAVNVRYADGRHAKRRAVKGVFVRLLGRDSTFTAICEPKRETALIGAIVLEDLDLLVDCVTQQVVPRDPDGETFEIEVQCPIFVLTCYHGQLLAEFN
jgi:predicted aspartyl protease